MDFVLGAEVSFRERTEYWGFFGDTYCKGMKAM
jgi:hypothetical protein